MGGATPDPFADGGVPGPTMLLDPQVIEDPYPFYDALRTTEPVWRVPGTSVVVVTSFAAVSEAVNRPQDFSSNITALIHRAEDGTPATVPFGGDGTNVLATADPPVHTLHRRTVFPELVARRMKELRPQVDDLTLAHLRPALAAGSFDFMSEVGDAVPIRVVSRLVGWHDEDPDELLAAAFDSTSILRAVRPLAEVEAAGERTEMVGAWIADQLHSALADPPEGLLGVIAEAIQRDELTFLDGLIMLHTLLGAGGESTTGLLGNAVHVLASDPHLQESLRTDPELVTPFIEEVLRFESPFRQHMRHVRHDTELLGTPVPAGSTVLLMWAAANRDPAEFDRPDEIVLDRPSPRHHLGFGRGIHHCVGAPLARLEADVVLRRLLELTKSFRLDPDRRAVREESLMIRRFRALPLVVETAAPDHSAS